MNKLFIFLIIFCFLCCKKPTPVAYNDTITIHFIRKDGTEFFTQDNTAYQKDSIRIYRPNSVLPIDEYIGSNTNYYGYSTGNDLNGKTYFGIVSNRG